MAAIDIGPGATDRAAAFGQYYTNIAKGNPANLSGTLDHLDIWLQAYSSGTIDFATFYVVSGNYLSTRGTALGLTPAAGDNDFDAPGDFTAFDVESGDYLGVYLPLGVNVEVDTTGGSGFWFKASDEIPCTNVEFSSNDSYELSIGGTGSEPSTYTPRVIMIG